MNWGTKIVLGMSAFMLFIIGMVVYMFKANDDSLVEDDYYERGISYDKDYDAKKNVILDQATPIITIHEQQISIKLVASANYRLRLMRPSSAKLDREINGETNQQNEIILSRKDLAKGLWSLKLEWQSGNKNYLFVKDIML